MSCTYCSRSLLMQSTGELLKALYDISTHKTLFANVLVGPPHFTKRQFFVVPIGYPLVGKRGMSSAAQFHGSCKGYGAPFVATTFKQQFRCRHKPCLCIWYMH